MDLLLTSLSGEGAIDWQLIEEYSKKYSQDERAYTTAVKLLLNKYDIALLDDKRKEDIFDNFIVKDCIHSFLIVFNYFSMETEASLRRDKYFHLLCKFVFEGQTLEKMLLKHRQCEIMNDDQFETSLISFPEIVANAYQMKTPKKCLPVPYFTHLSKSLLMTLSKLHELIKDGHSADTRFLSSLSGRILFNNQTNIYWKNTLHPIMVLCESDFIWRKIAHKLVENQNDRFLEYFVKPIFCYAPNSKCVFWLIDNYVERSEKLKFILTNKLLLVCYFEDNAVVKNIIEYLAIHCKPYFLEAILNVLNAWCNSLSIKHRSKAQHVYLSSALLVALKYLRNCELERYKQEYVNATMHGIQLYLKCSLPDIRNVGLFVGQTFITAIQGDGPKLDFELEETDDIKNLKLLLNEPVIDHEIEVNVFDVLQKTINDVKNNAEVADTTRILEKNNDDDDDDDDIFVASDLSGDIPLAQSKKPVYLRDCMEGLMDDEKPDWAVLCLQNAADVITANKEIVSEVAMEFATALLYLNDNYSVDNFESLRLSAMVALCVAAPRSVSEYLTSQFYDRNLSISRRIDILEVMGVSCQQISDASRNEQKMKCLSLSSTETSISDEDWKVVINARLKEKTKIIASKTRVPEASVNEFASVAGYFFYPLMKNYSEIKLTFNLEEDHYLLGKLLYTLGIVLHSASQTWPSRQMGKSLLQFLWAFRYHEEAFVRQSVIFCFSVVIAAVPSFYLLNELRNEILEFQRWLLDVIENDSNADCVKRSFQALNLLKSFVKSDVT